MENNPFVRYLAYIYIYGQRYIPLLEKKILYILRNRKRKIPITLPRKELGMGLMPSIGGGRNTCLSSQMRSNPPTRISFPCRLYKSSKRMSGREEGVNGIVWKNRDPSPHRSTPTWTPAKNKFATWLFGDLKENWPFFHINNIEHVVEHAELELIVTMRISGQRRRGIHFHQPRLEVAVQ